MNGSYDSYKVIGRGSQIAHFVVWGDGLWPSVMHFRASLEFGGRKVTGVTLRSFHYTSLSLSLFHKSHRFTSKIVVCESTLIFKDIAGRRIINFSTTNDS